MMGWGSGSVNGKTTSSFFDNDDAVSSNDGKLGNGLDGLVGNNSTETDTPSTPNPEDDNASEEAAEQSGSAAETDTVNVTEDPVPNGNGTSNVQKAMIGVLSVAGVAVIAAVVARRFKKQSAHSSDPSVFESLGPV